MSIFKPPSTNGRTPKQIKDDKLAYELAMYSVFYDFFHLLIFLMAGLGYITAKGNEGREGSIMFGGIVSILLTISSMLLSLYMFVNK